MSKNHDRGPLDWLVEVAGAAAPAVAAAFAAARLAPVNGWPIDIAALAGLSGVFVAAFLAMRMAPGEARHLALPDFEPAVIPDDVLLLDQAYAQPGELLLDQPLVEAEIEAVAELLLDDALPAPTPESRVVQLFAAGRMPTAGQLKDRIDRHLADGEGGAERSYASDALSDALAELRRSLRQA